MVSTVSLRACHHQHIALSPTDIHRKHELICILFVPSVVLLLGPALLVDGYQTQIVAEDLGERQMEVARSAMPIKRTSGKHHVCVADV